MTQSKLILCLAFALSGSSFVAHAEETNLVPATTKITITFDDNGTANNQTVTSEAADSSKGLADAVATNFEKYVLSSTNITPTNAAAALPQVLEFAKTNVFPALAEVGEGGDFLMELKQQGRLPGVEKNSHGHLTTGTPFPAHPEAGHPSAITFDLVLTGDSFTNHYTIGRMTEGAPWQLEKAWRTDTQGHTVVEWQTK